MDFTPLRKVKVDQGGVAIYPPGATFGPRRLHDFEFVWIIEGDVTAQFDGHTIPAPPGTILLARRGMTDRYDWARERRTVHAFFHFDFELPPSGWPPLAQWPLARHLSEDDILRPLFRYVISVWRRPEPERTQLIAPTVNLMAQVFVSGATGLAIEPHGDLPAGVEKALTVIRDAVAHDPPRALTLRDLARSVHVTPEHLCRLFRRSLDLGPLECLGLARLERAASLLARSNMAIKEIADTTGFSSPHHFSNKFKRIYGASPRAFRQMMLRGEPARLNPVVRVLRLPVPPPAR